MKANFVYPGSFAPPTFGHFEIAKRAAEIFPHVTIICSKNKDKEGKCWFSEEECKEMWKSYDLPENVSVKTFTENVAGKKDFRNTVMIRGIRDENDIEDENRVMKLNKDLFGINKYFYMLAENDFVDISSSRARKAAQEFDFQFLAKSVPPAIVTVLLEKVMKIKNLFMVVGRPGSGKSTFVEMLSEIDNTNVHINTDLFSQNIKPLLVEKFGKGTDLIELAISRGQELSEFIAPIWFQFLAEVLRKIPANVNVFLEIPYGLKPEKALYRHVGHKILYVGCEDQSENRQRIMKRGTGQHARFINEIPNLKQSIAIAQEHQLKMNVVDTSGEISKLRQKADNFLGIINHRKEGAA